MALGQQVEPEEPDCFHRLSVIMYYSQDRVTVLEKYD